MMKMTEFAPPNSVDTLIQRAQQLAGLSFLDLAKLTHSPCPPSLHHAKGWLGQILERVLGADAANLACPDFAALQIELKTLPISSIGLIKESTYVTYAPIPFTEQNWENSTVFHKMKKVLWVPYLAEGDVPKRTLAMPFLWHMPKSIESILKEDWEELTERLRLHHFESLNGKLGKYLHIRPKAPNSKTWITLLNHSGEPIKVVPKGFYLRSQCTQKILQEYFNF